jgi:hypothetical protein
MKRTGRLPRNPLVSRRSDYHVEDLAPGYEPAQAADEIDLQPARHAGRQRVDEDAHIVGLAAQLIGHGVVRLAVPDPRLDDTNSIGEQLLLRRRGAALCQTWWTRPLPVRTGC